jgi:hypothetical protein
MPEIKWTEGKMLRVPLTDEEVRQRGELLAKACQDLEELKGAQKEEKELMKIALQRAEGDISRLVTQVRDRAETRHVQVEMRINIGLGIVEEVRLDTGEVVRTRDATQDDKMRAQALAQDDFFEAKKDPAPPEISDGGADQP